MNRRHFAQEAGSLARGTASGTHRGLENVQPAPSPASEGNSRALKHGARSKLTLDKLAAPLAEDLQRRYPDVEAEECLAQAVRLAAIELALMHVAELGIVKPGKSGHTLDIARRMIGWTSVTDKWFAERRAEAQAKRTEHGAAMREVLARLEADREPPQDATIADEDEGLNG